MWKWCLNNEILSNVCFSWYGPVCMVFGPRYLNFSEDQLCWDQNPLVVSGGTCWIQCLHNVSVDGACFEGGNPSSSSDERPSGSWTRSSVPGRVELVMLHVCLFNPPIFPLLLASSWISLVYRLFGWRIESFDLVPWKYSEIFRRSSYSNQWMRISYCLIGNCWRNF